MVAAVFNHRYLGFPALPDSAEWVWAAIAFLRERAGSFHLDPDRLAIWAFSAGGPHLGPFLTEKPSWARCLLGFYSVLDIRSVREDLPALTEEAANRFSPVACLPESGYDGPPVLIARAGLDRPVINGTADAFVARALAANVQLDVLNHARGRHGFDSKDDDERSREILRHAIDFLRAHL
jgi:acetyl esterase/lipase